MILFEQIIETNSVSIVLLSNGELMVRINGNIRSLSDVVHLVSLESFRTERGPLTA